MGRIKLPHVHSFRNRHGTMVFYFRKPGCKSARLRGIPGSAEFMRAYEAALGNVEPIVIGADRAKVGTIAATVGMYLASAAFAHLADATQGLRKAMCRRLAEAGCTEKQIAAISGHKTLRMMQHYTEAADQERMARAAIEQLGNDSVAHLERRIRTPHLKPLKLKD